ncbi:hypothetical protein MP228_010095 [Amoeboaphelidium protococcarum]|nr:hypothetical protein MP228_010095 [Amoeboaphelidium protococcarum]
MLTHQQIEQFNKEGYLVVENFLSNNQTSSLHQRTNDIIDQIGLLYQPQDGKSVDIDALKDVKPLPHSKFTTQESNHTGDKYFLESVDKLSWFFEDGALGEDGEFKVPFSRAINKIGHGLHLHDQMFQELTLSLDVQQICRDLQYKDPRVLQTMLILKHPQTGGEVRPHQDSTFLYTTPEESTLGFWIALEDVTLENGCLWFIPGSHKTHSKITRRFERNPEFFADDQLRDYKAQNQQEQAAVKATRFVTYGDQCDQQHVPDTDSPLWKPVTMKKGSLVLIHGAILHKSERNLSLDKSRFAYAFHVIEGSLQWPKENWIQSAHEFTKLYQQ